MRWPWGTFRINLDSNSPRRRLCPNVAELKRVWGANAWERVIRL